MGERKIALITGASRGLGRSMATHLARAGIGIIGTYNNSKREADELAAEISDSGCKVAMLHLDVRGPGTFAPFAREVVVALNTVFGCDRFDFLINNAGIGIYAPFAQTTEEQFDELVQVNLKAPFFVSQALLPQINDGGRILNLSSGLTRFSQPGYAAYAASKAAIDVLTRYQAIELAERRIRVNALAPGAIETDWGGGLVRDNQEINSRVASNTALGRAGVPDDIGAVVVSLLSDDFGWVNGTKIEASGGAHL
jgi:NAD(P)-dependent dehydrogenase (short-subunit alcohol dehydrogenase family)